MTKYLILLSAILTMSSCSESLIPESTELQEIVNQEQDKVLWGEYEVLYVIHQYDDGKYLMFTPQESPYGDERDGYISDTKFNFTQDKLFISQLLDEGWDEGSVSLEWKDNKPRKVGCKIVVESSETMISWRQNDQVLKYYLTKL